MKKILLVFTTLCVSLISTICLTGCVRRYQPALGEKEVCIFKFSDSTFADKIILDQIDDTLAVFHTYWADFGPDCQENEALLSKFFHLIELPSSTKETIIPLVDGYYYFGRYRAIGGFEPIAIDASWKELSTITSAKSLGNPFSEMWMIPVHVLYRYANIDVKCISTYGQVTEALNNIILHNLLKKQCIRVEHWNYIVPGMVYSETNHFFPNPANVDCYEEGYKIRIY